MSNLIIESLYGKYDAVQESAPKRKRLTEAINPSANEVNDFIRNWRGEYWPIDDKDKKMLKSYGIDVQDEWYVDPKERRYWEDRGYDVDDEDVGEYIIHLIGPNGREINSHDFSTIWGEPGKFVGVSDDFDYVNYLNEPFDESLTEARNPENDEVNAVIRKWANSDRNRLSKKDQEILDKNGLSLEDDAWMKGSKHIAGPAYNKDNESRYMTKGYVKGTHPDYDLKGYLSKKPQSYNDTEVPIASWRSPYVKANEDQPRAAINARYRKDAEQKMSPNQFKSLQPYADEKKEFRHNKEDSEYAYKRAKEVQARAKDKLKNAMDYYDRDMSYASSLKNDAADYKKDAYRALHQAKEKHNAKKKNESLSLKEDLASAIPSFNDAFSVALKDVIWRGMKESEADRLVRGIVDATNLLLTDLFETIKMLDERISELENK